MEMKLIDYAMFANIRIFDPQILVCRQPVMEE